VRRGSDLGCFSTDTIDIILEMPPMTFDTISTCPGDPVIIDGLSYLVDTTLVQSIPISSAVCDSIHRITINVLDKISSSEALNACEGDTLMVFGDVILQNGIFSEIYPASNGCDSTHIITTNFIEAIFTNEFRQLCEGDTTIVFGTPIFQNDLVAQTFISSVGCDSTHRVSVEFFDVILTFDTLQLCEGDTAIVFGNTVLVNSTWQETYPSSDGCDSTHSITVNFIEPLLTEESIQLCIGDTAIVFGNPVFQNEILSQTFVSSIACDSIHEVTVEFFDVIFTFDTLQFCTGDTAVIFGNLLTENSVLSEDYSSSFGCDSTHTISALFIAPVFTNESIQLCEGDTAIVFGNPIFQDDLVSQTFNSSRGCDSTHSVNVEVFDVSFTFDTLRLCEGDTAIIFGTTVVDNNTLSESFLSTDGCDSTHQIAAIFNENILTSEQIQLCLGDTVFVSGMAVFANRVIEQSYTAANGCDSTHQIEVMFSEPFFASEEINLCAGDTIFVFGNRVTQDDVLLQNLVALNGCDSVQEIIVTVWEEIEIYTTELLCEGSSLGFFNQTITEAGTYIERIPSNFGACDTLYVLEVEMQPAIEFSLPNGVSTFAEEAIRLPLAINAPDLQVTWSPADGLSCTDCISPFAILSEDQNYTVLLSDENGCSTMADISVFVSERERTYIPNAFSPNFDGFNDFLTVYSNEKIIAIERMQIYDRWGGLLFEGLNIPPNTPSAGWDGTVNGQAVSEGIYVYQVWLKLADGTSNIIAGEVAVIR